MKSFAVILLVATLGAAASSGSVTVVPSNIGFKAAIAACPSGTLGAISLALGHVRIAEGEGATTDVDDANPNAQSVALSKGSLTASVMVNASKNSVAAKHVSLASGRRVACIAPD